MKLSKEFIAVFREEAKKATWEINRWNGKSIDDLVVDYLERKKLKPEDFTGAVILTVDEAKELQCGFSQGFISTIYLWIDKNASKFSRILKERIEQAEGKR